MIVNELSHILRKLILHFTELKGGSYSVLKLVINMKWANAGVWLSEKLRIVEERLKP